MMQETREELAQRIFDSFPDTEPFKEFDDFFVGGASHHQMNAPATPSFAWQLSNIQTVADLERGAPEEGPIETEDDLGLFIKDKVDILDDAQYERLFFATKKKVFALFDFVDVRSSVLGDAPVREKDLILDENDYYVIEYLKGNVTDYFAVSSIAALTAFENMGIRAVKFKEVDGCPLCLSLNGSVFSTGWLINLLGSGNHVSHLYCDCRFVPVIQREMYEGPLRDHLDKESILVEGGCLLKSVPVELEDEIRAAVPLLEGVRTVEFVDMRSCLSERSDLDREGIVVLQEGDTLRVHNSYVGSSGPVDFLKGYATCVPVPDKVEVQEISEEEIFYVKGRRALFREGKFWDVATGERLR